MSEKALEIYTGDTQENEQPLNKSEEKAYEKNKMDKAQEEIDGLFARVKNIKSAIENPDFYDIGLSNRLRAILLNFGKIWKQKKKPGILY